MFNINNKTTRIIENADRCPLLCNEIITSSPRKKDVEKHLAILFLGNREGTLIVLNHPFFIIVTRYEVTGYYSHKSRFYR